VETNVEVTDYDDIKDDVTEASQMNSIWESPVTSSSSCDFMDYPVVEETPMTIYDVFTADGINEHSVSRVFQVIIIPRVIMN